MIKGMELVSQQERLRKTKLLSMEKRCFREISSINNLMRGNEEEAVSLFTLVPTEKGHKLKNMTFHLLLCTLLERWDWA